jgi:large subunit ribosomal protein L46
MKKYRLVSAVILSKKFSQEKKYLIVKKPRKNHAWQFPQGGVDNGESAIQAAERELREECGKDLRINFLFNDSVGEYKYNFPSDFKRHDKNTVGAIVKFFPAEFVSGKVEIDNNEIIDHKWVKKDEFKNYFDLEYLEIIQKIF